MEYSIAIVGTADVILGFKALGLETHPVNSPAEALEKIEELSAASRPHPTIQNETVAKYAVIFIIEDIAEGLPEDRYKKLTSKPLPAIIPLPGPKGSTGFGEARLKKLIIQAVGTEI